MGLVIISLLSAAAIAAADQGTKYLAVSKLTSGIPVKLLSVGDTEILTFSLYRNTGAAFSSMQGKTVFLIIMTTLLMAGLVLWLVKSKPQNKLPVICVVMIVGGGIGNLIDRILLGYVVDFIILFPFGFIFNLADVFVVAGAALLMIYCLLPEKHPDNGADEDNEERAEENE